MSDFFIISLWVFSIFIILLITVVSTGMKKLKEEMHNKVIADFESVLKTNKAQAVILCQNETTLPRIPKGDLCYLMAGDEKFIIKTKSEPIMTYELDYDKIYLFKKIKVKKTRPSSTDTQKIEEYTLDQIVIQYVDDDSSIKELVFLFGDTKEDTAFNNYALQQNDIFEVVNKKIPRRDNTVSL